MPIAPVLAHYGVYLTGRHQEAVLCPVHGEGRPSCTVNEEKGVFFCHACGAKGSAVQLIMEMERCDRATALTKAEEILRESGIAIRNTTRERYRRPGVPDKPGDQRQRGRFVPPGRRS